MADSQNPGGAPALLFERLVDDEAHCLQESPPFRVLSRQELWESVNRELGRLLNTRCPVPLHLLDEAERTVINYGVPDFTSLSPLNPDDRKLIASVIAQTITAFEPRLRNVRVRVVAEHIEEDERTRGKFNLRGDGRHVLTRPFEEDERTLHISVEADLVTDAVIQIRSYPEFGSSAEPVSFPIVLNSKTGLIELYER